MPGYSEIFNASHASGHSVETDGWMDIDLPHIKDARPWSDRWLFRDILDHFGCLTITYDSHFGEYIQCAYDASDHCGILDFYTYYRNNLGNQMSEIKGILHERVLPVMEGILINSGYEEAAVIIPNTVFIQGLPDWIIVEILAVITASGVEGIKVDLPAGIRGSLSNQIGIHDMPAEAILNKSRNLMIQALLFDPVVTVSKGIPVSWII